MKKSLEAQISEKESRINKLSEELRSGKEFRDVDCQWHYYWNEGVKMLLRLDTMESIKEDIITDEDRQMKLDLDAEAKHSNESSEGNQYEFDVVPVEITSEVDSDNEQEVVPETEQNAESAFYDESNTAFSSEENQTDK